MSHRILKTHWLTTIANIEYDRMKLIPDSPSTKVIQHHKSEYGGLSRPLWYDLSVSNGTLSNDD